MPFFGGKLEVFRSALLGRSSIFFAARAAFYNMHGKGVPGEHQSVLYMCCVELIMTDWAGVLYEYLNIALADLYSRDFGGRHHGTAGNGAQKEGVKWIIIGTGHDFPNSEPGLIRTITPLRYYRPKDDDLRHE